MAEVETTKPSRRAWRLAQRGLKVQIFDAKKAASGASWAAAGML